MNEEYLKRFRQSAIILLLLEEANFEMVYIDEFSMGTRTKSMYNWDLKGTKEVILKEPFQFEYNFMVLAS